MAEPRLYLDEDVSTGVAVGLRRRGFDAMTTLEANRTGCPDDEQLRFAASQGRCLFTFNRGDYARLHGQLLGEGGEHFGIIVSPQVTIGSAVRRLSMLLSTNTAEDLCNQLIWLSGK